MLLRCGSRFPPQKHTEHGTVMSRVLAAADPELPFVTDHDIAADPQAQAGSAWTLHRKKWLEDPLDVLLRDAGASIANRNHDALPTV
jgi:hypothetical protein